jgi:hypothetical protein
MRAVKAGVIYFLLVFRGPRSDGIMGPIRELRAVAHFGQVAAMLSEAIIMLTPMIVAARWSFGGSTCLEHSLRRSRWG